MHSTTEEGWQRGQVDKREEGRRDVAAAGAHTDSGICTSAPEREHSQQLYLGGQAPDSVRTDLGTTHTRARPDANGPRRRRVQAAALGTPCAKRPRLARAW